MAKTQMDTPPVESADLGDELAQTREALEQYWKPVTIAACLVAIVGAGMVIMRTHKGGLARDAAAELGQARTAQHLQDVLEAYPEAPTAPSALIRLAKEYYDTLNFAKAEETYRRFLEQYPGHLWEPTATLGLAHCSEARDDFAGALSGYEAFAQAHADHFLYAQAVLGQARCQDELGDVAEAKAICEDFLASREDDAWAPAFEGFLELLDMKLKRAQGSL